MAQVTAEMVKELRARTDAPMMDCKKALVQADGDMEKAITLLRERGLAAAAKKVGRAATDGLVEAYIHPGGRIGVLIEVNCETDFVARTPDFTQLVRDLAMQVAARRPEHVSREEVPAAVVEREKGIYAAAARNEGRPDRVIEKIVTGKIEKYFEQACLLEQPFIKDEEKTVQQLIQEMIARLGENIAVRRFVRFERGEGLGSREADGAAQP